MRKRTKTRRIRALKLDRKSTNPKDAIGSNKLPFSLVPSSMRAFCALGMLEGACKYGRYNYRALGVQASIYYDALNRHIESWWNGEDTDPKTGIPHLASALSCIAIILDAGVSKKLTDDRPPQQRTGELIRLFNSEVPRIKRMFKKHKPYQYTIADSRRVA